MQIVGIKEADSPVMAREALTKEGLMLLEITSTTEKKTEGTFTLFGTSYKPAELAMVTKQLSTLIGAGLPLAQALEILIDQLEDSKFETVFRDVKERITQGQPLADAMAVHKRAFPPLYTNMIRAGEASGNLDLVLKRLSEFVRKSHLMQSKIISAFTYPMIMMFVGTAVVIFLLTFVVPKIALILKESHKVLPLPTKILLAISGFIQSFWPLLLLLGFLTIVGFRFAIGLPRGRYLWDSFILQIPLLGSLLKKHILSRFALTFSTLLKSGLPALEALEVVTPVVGNKVIEEVLISTREKVLGGADLSTPLQEAKIFPPLVGGMIGVGEHSGNLEEMLDRIAEHYQEEIDISTQRLLSMLEPLLIILMAIVVGFIVLSIILPILSLSDIAR